MIMHPKHSIDLLACKFMTKNYTRPKRGGRELSLLYRVYHGFIITFWVKNQRGINSIDCVQH